MRTGTGRRSGAAGDCRMHSALHRQDDIHHPAPVETESDRDVFWLEGSGMVVTSLVTIGGMGV